MRVVVGLGNPGEEYAHTRHNAGFEVVDLLASEWGVTYWKNTCGALVGEGKLRHSDGSVEKVILAKPQSFMNLSGGPTSKLCKEYDCPVEELIVIHDELDIDPRYSAQVGALIGDVFIVDTFSDALSCDRNSQGTAARFASLDGCIASTDGKFSFVRFSEADKQNNASRSCSGDQGRGAVSCGLRSCTV